MLTAQMNSPRFSYQGATATVPNTLDDFRVVRGNYAGSFSGPSKQPLFIAGLLIAALAGGVYAYLEYYAPEETAATVSADPSLPVVAPPTAAAVPSTLEAPAATDSPATNPLGTLTKSEEANSMPMAGHGNNHSSESMNPAKATVTPKAASAPVAKKVAPKAVAPVAPAPVAPPATPTVNVVVPAEPIPPTVPAPIVEPAPVVPAPAPIDPPVEPAKL